VSEDEPLPLPVCASFPPTPSLLSVLSAVLEEMTVPMVTAEVCC
jgi:hypothetical protein